MIPEAPGSVVTPDGLALEAMVSRPPRASRGVVLCHPHPLYGGDMDNPVVVRAAEVCADLGLGTLRFNFRGVGGSQGTHGDGIAERADAEAALAHLGAVLAPPARLGLLGYSFGAGVAARVAAAGSAVAGLCLIAPALALPGHLLSPALKAFPGSILVVAGTRDQYCPPAALAALSEGLPAARVRVIEGADHFFLGKLFPLGEAVADWARAALDL